MGTSKSRGGVKGGKPLLPSWAPGAENAPNDETPIDNENSGTTSDIGPDLSNINRTPSELAINTPAVGSLKSGSNRGARAWLKKYTDTGNRAYLRNAASSYVKKARGGAASARKAAQAGIRASTSLALFFSGAAINGFNQTLIDYGLADCIGKDADYTLVRIADKVLITDGSLDDSIARKAILESLVELYESLDGDDIGAQIDALPELRVVELTISTVINFIYFKWMNDFADVIETKDISPAQAISFEREIHQFIKGAVKIEMNKIPLAEFKNEKAGSIITSIYQDAYSQLELI